MLDILIIGAGPAGLMAADRLSSQGLSVCLVDQMPSVARKFLMAGRGGLNLTHSEPLDQLLTRYREAEPRLAPMIRSFTPDDLRAWCTELGQETFVGSSGRIFPTAMKASPLLRALLARLSSRGVEMRLRTKLVDLPASGGATVKTAEGATETIPARAILLALGGASWPRLGSDADWVSLLSQVGVAQRRLRPANCGFYINWSAILKDRFAGTPLKRVQLSLGDVSHKGEAVISERGLEGGVVYALSAEIRDAIEAKGDVTLHVDLRPDLTAEALHQRLEAGPGKQSMATFLKKRAGLTSAEASLLRETGDALPRDPDALARLIKALPLVAHSPYPIDRAISSAGGVSMDELTDGLMVQMRPGLFLAGEMLDWEAPTGGYLLQACFATGYRAAEGISQYLNQPTATEAAT
ncbi:NAD(P)/FAD-dependent oxidoreductase [Roseibium sp.]|uniref:NAD(P)/FAD-dependent oxidoreductase n=1 Tax=Roseibium sp. TaxID=1936156 RepID=UPI003A97E4DD